MSLLLKHHADPAFRLPRAEKGEPATPWEFAEASDLQAADRCATLVEIELRERAAETALLEEKQDAASLVKLKDKLGEKYDLRVMKGVKIAIRHGNVAYVSKWLREGGRDTINTVPLEHGVWAMTAAAGFGQPEVVRRLLRAKASADPPADSLGHFPLLMACAVGNEGQAVTSVPSHRDAGTSSSHIAGLPMVGNLSFPRSSPDFVRAPW